MQDVAKPSKGKLIVLILLTGTITLLHFLVPTDQHTFHIIHIVLRKLYFLPPVIAAAWYGFRGAVSVTLAISILFSFHAILDWPDNYMEQANQAGELVGFWVAGIVAGRLFERERSLLKNLVQANEETLLGLVSALDMKEHNTHLHSQRVKQNTLLLADRFGLDEARKRAIGFGALLHDVGKIAVPDAILLKPGPLTDEEQKIMRNHPSVGYGIVNRIEFLSEAAEIVYAHHERFDGSGYPRGLKGEDIPLGARLFAVVDVYDALTSARSYHSPLSHKEALVEIRKESGRHFDPNVVEVFLSIPHKEFDKEFDTA
jgi:putative nucleotidyltransferase with HDIG domain